MLVLLLHVVVLVFIRPLVPASAADDVSSELTTRPSAGADAEGTICSGLSAVIFAHLLQRVPAGVGGGIGTGIPASGSSIVLTFVLLRVVLQY